MNKTLATAITLLHSEYTHVLEFGVNSGRTINQLRNTLPDKYKLFGFDSFEGLPEDWTGTSAKKGSMSTGGIIPDIKNVTFYKGWFTDTIPVYKQCAEPIALLHVDCDLYSSTIDVLYNLKDFIVSNSIIVFDEWYYNHKDIPENRLHEQKAFLEWVRDFNISYHEYPLIEDERKIVKIL